MRINFLLSEFEEILEHNVEYFQLAQLLQIGQHFKTFSKQVKLWCLLNCAPCAPSCPHALPIIDTCFMHLYTCASNPSLIRALPIINTRMCAWRLISIRRVLCVWGPALYSEHARLINCSVKNNWTFFWTLAHTLTSTTLFKQLIC